MSSLLRSKGFMKRLQRSDSAPPVRKSATTKVTPRLDDCAVLVANSTLSMAQAITAELTTSLPGCAIIYAPTLELAGWILKRRRIDLLVASPLLPDGRIDRLGPILERLANRPDVVVVAEGATETKGLFDQSTYRNAQLTASSASSKWRMRPSGIADGLVKSGHDSLAKLGADLRNDLNNPLQEIVSMVFVAQASGGLSPTTQEALSVIDSAAQTLASTVANLEGRIRGKVASR